MLQTGPLQESEYGFLEEMLAKYGTEYSLPDVSALDGFLTAVASGPNTIMPSIWLPAIWDVEEEGPEWESEEEFKRFFQLSVQMMNFTIDILMHQPESLEALFNVVDVGGREFMVSDSWCQGYLRGVELDEEGWHDTPDELIFEHLSAIALFTGEHDDHLEGLSLDSVMKLQDKIEPAARALHAYFLSQREVEPQIKPIVKKNKTGRNDPCPCGSGKKFKQCCLH